MTASRASARDCPVRWAWALACLERTSSAISAMVCSGRIGFPLLPFPSQVCAFDCNIFYKDSQHSPTPIGRGAPDEGYPYRRALLACVRAPKAGTEEGLGHRDGGEHDKGRSSHATFPLRGSGLMREAGRAGTGEVAVSSKCARPTGGSYGRTARGSAQRGGGTKRRPRPRGVSQSAARDSIKAGTP